MSLVASLKFAEDRAVGNVVEFWCRNLTYDEYCEYCCKENLNAVNRSVFLHLFNALDAEMAPLMGGRVVETSQ